MKSLKERVELSVLTEYCAACAGYTSVYEGTPPPTAHLGESPGDKTLILIMSKKLLMSTLTEKYVKVDQKEVSEKEDPPVSKSKLLSGRARLGRSKLSVIKTRLAISGSVSSSAATALSTVINVDPSSSAEWTNFQQLFDEVKVYGGVLHFHVLTAGGTPIEQEFALAYDPTNGGAYTSVAGVLVADQSVLKRATVSSAAAALDAPQPVNNSGFWEFRFKCPEAPQKVASNVLVDAEVCTGLWADVTNSVTPKYGYIKPYAPSAGASVVFSIYYYLVLDCAFRSRS